MRVNNHIIIEGFWGIGKSAVAKELEKQGYFFLPEPIYNKSIFPQSGHKIESWYFNKHRDREKVLQNNRPTVLERSELSTFAYSYVATNKIPTPQKLLFFSKLLKLKKVLLVYFTSERPIPSVIKLNNDIHGKDIKKIIKNTVKLNRYENWYQSILPYNFGITPFMLQVSTQKKRLLPDQIANTILACIKSNRIGQINIVIFRKTFAGKLEVLILKRTKKRGGFWQTITGGIHIGEALHDCAKRELKEELSISETNFISTNFSYSFVGNEGYMLREYVFTVLITEKKSQKIRLSNEHDEYKWLQVSDAFSYLGFEDNKTAIKYASKIIKKVRPK